MTREEAIEILSRPFYMTKVPKDILIAHQMAVKLLNQEPCEDCVSKANALHIGKNEYLRGWHDALCKALSEKYSIHCKEGNFNVIQEETITGLGLSMDYAIGKDVESYISALPSVTPIRKKGHWKWEEDWTPSTPVSPAECNYAGWVCSECGEFPDEYTDWDNPDEEPTYEYCPNCGTKMEKEVDK